MAQVIANRLQMKAREKTGRYQGRTPGALVPLLLSSGGMLDLQMQVAWMQWSTKDLRFWKQIVAKLSCILI